MSYHNWYNTLNIFDLINPVQLLLTVYYFILCVLFHYFYLSVSGSDGVAVEIRVTGLGLTVS